MHARSRVVSRSDALGFVVTAPFVLLALYMTKCALGIDLIPGWSTGIWTFLTRLFG